MRTAFPLWLCLMIAVQCGGQTPGTIQYESLPGVALYSSGYLFSWDSPTYSQVTLYGRDAKPAYSMREGSQGFHHSACAVDSDGVAAGAYQVRYSWEGRVDMFDPSGKLTLTIRTGSYLPEHIAFFRDHTIWTVGYNAGNGGKEDFNVLRHYTRSGQELGQALPWSQIAGDFNSYTALQPFIGGRQLFTSEDRIGFESRSHNGHDTWIEMNSSGALTGKYDLGAFSERYYFPVAMTAGGDVYARTYNEDVFDGWAVLDRSQQTWRKIVGFPRGRIIGSDGDRVVFARHEANRTVLDFVPSATLRSENRQDTAVSTSRPARVSR